MRRSTRGAAAVEFALVLPVLLAFLLGIAELGYLIMLDSTAAMAAREGAREMAISQNRDAAIAVASAAFSGDMGGQTPTSVVVPYACTEGGPVEVKVTYTYPTLTQFFLPTFTANGTGEMRCGG